MRTELEMVKGSPPITTVEARKIINEAAASLVHDAILKNELNPLAEKLAGTMLATARMLTGLNLEPDLENFVYACSDLVSYSRKSIDDALRFNNMDDVKLASVMMEVVLKGCAATLGLPIDRLMEEVLKAEAEGRKPNMQNVLKPVHHDSFVLDGEKP